jgi:CRISPR-associated endonuclease Cas2
MNDIRLSFVNKDTYVISYDISSNKLRRKIEKALKNFGTRIQYSVFHCDADKEQLKRISVAVRYIVNTYCALVSDKDSIVFFGGLDRSEIKLFLGNASVSNKYMLY